MNNVEMLNTRPVLLAMLSKQYDLNAKVNPSWVDKGEPFWRALWAEAGEAMGHLRWEWWKSVDAAAGAFRDRDQFYLEVADMLHFSLSQLIIHTSATAHPEVDKDRLLDMAATRAMSAIDLADRLPGDNVVECVEKVAARALDEGSALPEVMKLAQAAGLGFGGLALFYFGKNVLNEFRQRNGYKEGVYRKVWADGCEDNVFLAKVLNEVRDNIEDAALLKVAHMDETRESVYGALDAMYQKVLASS